MRWRFLVPTIFVAVLIALSLVAGISRPALAQTGELEPSLTGVGPVTNFEVVNGSNPGEVVISWDTVPGATHYRIGYVNLDVDRPLALDRGAEWIEAFVYVDVAAKNLSVSEGRTEYTILRLAQGQRHAFTVLSSSDYLDDTDSVSGEFTWPTLGDRWRRLTVADHGSACPIIGVAAAASISPPDVVSLTNFAAYPDVPSGSDNLAGPESERSWDFPIRDVPVIRPSPQGGRNTDTVVDGVGTSVQGVAQSITPSVTGVRATPGSNPGEVIVSWDTVLAATHYRIGYVNLDVDRPLALDRGAEWIEAFVYVDVAAKNLPVSGGRTQYTILRLGQGNRHAFTVLTSGNYVDDKENVSGEFTWPILGDRWRRLTVADHGGACPGAVPIATQPVIVSLAGLKGGSFLEVNRPQEAAAIRALPWLGDGIDGAERRAAEALIASAYFFPDVFGALMQMSWLRDGITDDEAVAILTVRFVPFHHRELAGQMLQKSWVQDGINADEVAVLDSLYGIVWYPSENPPPLQPQYNAATSRILAMPFLDTVTSADALALQSLVRLKHSQEPAFLRVMSLPVLSDGITDAEAEVVLLLGGTYVRNPALVNTLLDPTRIIVEKRRISLPRSGEMDLAIIRTAPGPARSMDLLEQSVRSIEEFMGTPFPTNYIAALFEEVTEAGTNFGGTFIGMHPKYDLDDGSWDANLLPALTTHEVAHYYWIGSRVWIDEGGATFMEFAVENALHGGPVIADRYPCAYAANISALEALDPEQEDPEFICNYSLGERIFLGLYRNLGDPAFRRSFSKLYQLSRSWGGRYPYVPLEISHVRDAFHPLAPAADTVIARWYDGTEPYDLSYLDTGPVDPNLLSIDGGRVESTWFRTTDENDQRKYTETGQTFRFSLDEASRGAVPWVCVILPATADPSELSLEYMYNYEDGFAFERIETFEIVQWRTFDTCLWPGRRLVLPAGPTGRYWLYVYDGDRKVAEVAYEVTP